MAVLGKEECCGVGEFEEVAVLPAQGLDYQPMYNTLV